MRTRSTVAVLFVLALAGGVLLQHGDLRAQHGAGVTARRLTQNPLITTRSSATLGDNINGPTVIRVPAWIDRPLGRYYMYFAHHMGRFIRLAYANAIEGPWTVYEPGVLPVEMTAFFRRSRTRRKTWKTSTPTSPRLKSTSTMRIDSS
jgi:hypothetical protein